MSMTVKKANTLVYHRSSESDFLHVAPISLPAMSKFSKLKKLFRKSEPSVNQPHGLQAIGNSSFLSAVLQALTTVPGLKDLLELNDISSFSGPVTKALRDFFKLQKTTKSKNEPINAKNVLEALQQHDDKFSQDILHDAAEVLQLILEKMLEESGTGSQLHRHLQWEPPLFRQGDSQNLQPRVGPQWTHPARDSRLQSMLRASNIRRSSNLKLAVPMRQLFSRSNEDYAGPSSRAHSSVSEPSTAARPSVLAVPSTRAGTMPNPYMTLPRGFYLENRQQGVPVIKPSSHSIMQDYIQGSTKLTMRCRKCQNQAVTNSVPFVVLDIPLPEKPTGMSGNSSLGTLNDCLDEFSKAQPHPGFPIQPCTCQNKRAVITDSTVAIDDTPQLLMLKIERFHRMDDLPGVSVKVDGHISFPLILDLQRYCFSVPGEGKSRYYRLVSVVQHNGATLHGDSNYTAFVRTEFNSEPDWYSCEDEDVGKTAKEKVLECEAYILIYEKIGFSWSTLAKNMVRVGGPSRAGTRTEAPPN